MKKDTYESLLDAFRDLSSVSDEEIITPKIKKFITEGKSISLGFGSTELEDAKEILKQSKEDTIEVIDVNADTLEHIKDNKTYLGQAILQCRKCHANKFIDLSKVVASEEDEELYNVEDECPNCHTDGDGFDLVGQVSKIVPETPFEQEVVPDQEPIAEPEVAVDQETAVDDVDQQSDEVKFENAVEEPEQNKQEVPDEEVQKSEQEELDFTPEEEPSGLETAETEDDEFDLPELGDVVDSEEVRADDTSDDVEEVKEAKEEEEEPKEEVKPIRKKLRLPTHEALENMRSNRCALTEEVIHKIVSPEAVSKIIVSNGKTTIYEGLVEELPEDILQSGIEGFNVANGYLSCNIDTQEDAVKLPLAKILNCFNDDNTTKIIIWDADTDQEIFQGCRQDAIQQFGHYQFDSLDAPKVLCLTVKGFDDCIGDECAVVTKVSPEEELCDRIFMSNDLAKHNAEDQRSEEFWITESVYNKEDLKFVFDRYISGTSDKLIEEFKKVTGYKDELDEVCDRYNVKAIKADESLQGKDFDEMLSLAGKLGIKTLVELQDFARKHGDVKDTALLNVLRRAVADRKDLKEKVIESVTSFKTRKELSEALVDIKKSGAGYKVRRSQKDGYRYDLICEAVQEPDDSEIDSDISPEEYLEEAKAFAKEIENFSLIKVEELYYDEYGFDHTKPADEAEKLIADALASRIKEISSRSPVIAGEALAEDFEEDDDEYDEDDEDDDDWEDFDESTLYGDDLEIWISKYMKEYHPAGITEDQVESVLDDLRNEAVTGEGKALDYEEAEEFIQQFVIGLNESKINLDKTKQKLIAMFKGDSQHFNEAADIIIDWYKQEDNDEALKNPNYSDILDLLDASDGSERQTVAKAIGSDAEFALDSDEEEDDDIDEALIEPKSDETEQEYVSRFMGTKRAQKDFPNQKQRLAVAYSKFKSKNEDLEDAEKANPEETHILSKELIDDMVANGELDASKDVEDTELETEKVDNNLEAIDVVKDKLDIQSEDGMIVVAEKGQLDNPDAPKIETEVTEEESVAIEAVFHEEEADQEAAPVDESLPESYTKQELLDAVIDAYGYTEKEALDFIKTSSEETKKALVQGFRQEAKKDFYDESLTDQESEDVNIKPFFSNEDKQENISVKEALEGISDNKVLDISNEKDWETIEEYLIDTGKLPEKLHYENMTVCVGVNPGVRYTANGDGYPDEPIEGTADWDYAHKVSADDIQEYISKTFGPDNFTVRNLKEFDSKSFEEFLKERYRSDAEDDAWENYVCYDEEGVDFDAASFDDDLNSYFDEAYEDTVLYRTESGIIDKQGNIILEGTIRADVSEAKVTFKLTPTSSINEALQKEDFVKELKNMTFNVTNNLSEEVFSFSTSTKK